MPVSPQDDRNLISHEKHELDYLLKKWEKAADKDNREILSGQLKKFKADKDWAPHNRERFYEYVEEEHVLSLLKDKESKVSPVTVVKDSTEEEPPYTVIKKRAAVPRKKKKGMYIPLLLIVLGLLVIAALVFFLFFYKSHDAARMTEQAPGSGETESAAVSEGKIEEDASALLDQFKQIVADNTPLLFVGDQAVLLPGQEAKLDAIVESMTGFKKLELTLTGHTADTGLPARELELSRERALTIKNYLEKNLTGTELTITATGKGATEPVVKNVPVSEQQPNRRVEIAVNSAE
jgi:outer membrane protein OmpA-like peptidoglycan-associated protein